MLNKDKGKFRWWKVRWKSIIVCPPRFCRLSLLQKKRWNGGRFKITIHRINTPLDLLNIHKTLVFCDVAISEKYWQVLFYFEKLRRKPLRKSLILLFFKMKESITLLLNFSTYSLFSLSTNLQIRIDWFIVISIVVACLEWMVQSRFHDNQDN